MATVVVTGATGAFGSATVAALQKRRAQVIGLSRPVLDLSSIASVRAAARELNRTAGHIDALLNIASVFTSRYQKSVDGFELMLATNHLGPFLLTNLLRDRLASGGRVITVTAPSTTQVNIDRLLDRDRFNGFHSFGATKAANLMFTFELARRSKRWDVPPNAPPMTWPTSPSPQPTPAPRAGSSRARDESTHRSRRWTKPRRRPYGCE